MGLRFIHAQANIGRVAWSALGRRLNLKRATAHIVYGMQNPWFYRLGFGMLWLIFGN